MQYEETKYKLRAIYNKIVATDHKITLEGKNRDRITHANFLSDGTLYLHKGKNIVDSGWMNLDVYGQVIFELEVPVIPLKYVPYIDFVPLVKHASLASYNVITNHAVQMRPVADNEAMRRILYRVGIEVKDPNSTVIPGAQCRIIFSLINPETLI